MLRIAVAGAPHSTPLPCGTLQGLKRAHELGIRAMELEWVHMVPGDPRHIEAIGAKARGLDIALTVHAPYYINLNAKEPEKLEASKVRISKALSMAQLCGARSVCVHAAFYLSKDPALVLENVRCAISEIMERKAKYFPDVNLALETMGKITQFGTLEETLKIGKEFGIYPCVDFAHIYARYQGRFNTKQEWHELLDLYEAELGSESLQEMHIHYSGIAFGPSGERKHLPFSESDANWRDFLSALHERKVGGILVCESPVLEEDTLLLMNEWQTLQDGKLGTVLVHQKEKAGIAER